MTYSNELKYTKEHEWVRQSGQTAEVGITVYAIEQLGDVVHLDLPKVGTKFKSGDTFGTIESTKTVSDLFMPMAGTISAVNDALVNSPESITDDPHGKGWLVKVTTEGTASDLMSAADYEKYISESQ